MPSDGFQSQSTSTATIVSELCHTLSQQTLPTTAWKKPVNTDNVETLEARFALGEVF